jgi:hypothetical protein
VSGEDGIEVKCGSWANYVRPLDECPYCGGDMSGHKGWSTMQRIKPMPSLAQFLDQVTTAPIACKVIRTCRRLECREAARRGTPT